MRCDKKSNRFVLGKDIIVGAKNRGVKKRCRRAQVAGCPMMLRRYDKVVALTSRANTSLSALSPTYLPVHVVCRYLRCLLLLPSRPIDR